MQCAEQLPLQSHSYLRRGSQLSSLLGRELPREHRMPLQDGYLWWRRRTKGYTMFCNFKRNRCALPAKPECTSCALLLHNWRCRDTLLALRHKVAAKQAYGCQRNRIVSPVPPLPSVGKSY